MSDISLRFDGLVLAGSLALAASVFLLLAFGTWIAGLAASDNGPRLMLAARTAALFALLNVAALGLVAAYMDRIGPPISGPDWIDWLTVPSLILLIAGCVIVARCKPPPS